MKQLGVTKLELDYKLSNRFDEEGNFFRFRSKIKDKQNTQAGRCAWDVILLRAQ
ncbi:MAG TPA: hypothetical protein VGJ37_03130 [Pyrinomonadaceae bacterium]